MGISISIPCDPCINKFFHWFDEKVACTHNLKKNLADLEKSIEELKARREDLLRRVRIEEDRGLQRLAQVQVWLTNVEDIEKETDDLFRIRNDELQRLCLCGFCSKSLRSSYHYGKKVVLTLKEVEKKLQSRVFEVVAEQPQTSAVVEIQPPPIIVGQETMLDKAWKHLLENDVGIMGMHGMGGVGKTTLLTQVNNKFTKERCGFDYVIWIVVSKELNLEKIRDEIARKVGLKEKTKDIIYNFLKNKRFVLFLDDLWEKVDLPEIGIPVPKAENKCKVVFTTRSQDVCAQMGVEEPMAVKCMEDHVAYDLFQKKVGKRTLGSDPKIPKLAQIIAKKCHGLPLALNVIGETMSSKRTIEEWLDAICDLDYYASKFSGMEDKIFPLLKYSYDNLKEEEVKSCLLYCALYPEDYQIGKKVLIDQWICQGFISGSEGIERAHNKGHEIIGSLVRASLLIDKHGFRTDQASMHDVIREMALWIASDLGKQREAFIVRAGVKLLEMPKVENWRAVRRMSLMKNDIHHLVGSPECPELTTLLLQHTKLEKISSEFFEFMPKLVVLDLSENYNLSELPDGISELVSLHYLNLSNTDIHHLPMGGQGLKKLIHLDLRNTNKLSSLDGISNLHNLKVLELYGSSFSWDLNIVEELKTLKHLEVLTLGVADDAESLEGYLNSHRLVSCTRELKIDCINLESSTDISLPLTLAKLHKLWIEGCNISEIKMVHNPRNSCFLSLSVVNIENCQFLRELTFLMFAPNLTRLNVRTSNQLEDIINKEKAREGEDSGFVPFPKLISIDLGYLPKLESIYWRPLLFPCLWEIEVEGCPNLKKLPLDSQSCTTGEHKLIIRYRDESWIQGVEWNDEATKIRFLSSLSQLENYDVNDNDHINDSKRILWPGCGSDGTLVQ